MPEDEDRLGRSCAESGMIKEKQHVVTVDLDPTITNRNRAHMAGEQAVAIDDFLAHNRFAPVSDDAASGIGPYHLRVAFENRVLLFDLRDTAGKNQYSIPLDLDLFLPLMRDYSLICDRYHDAIGGGDSSARIAAVDARRRDLHDQGSEFLLTQLKGYVETDMETARHLFTLLYALTASHNH